MMMISSKKRPITGQKASPRASSPGEQAASTAALARRHHQISESDSDSSGDFSVKRSRQARTRTQLNEQGARVERDNRTQLKEGSPQQLVKQGKPQQRTITELNKQGTSQQQGNNKVNRNIQARDTLQKQGDNKLGQNNIGKKGKPQGGNKLRQPKMGNFFNKKDSGRSDARERSKTGKMWSSYAEKYSKEDTLEYRHNYPGKEDDPDQKKNYEFHMNEIPSYPDGDYIDDIHNNWFGDYERLERHHGYIQWLFPIRDSGMNYHAQELQLHEAEAIQENKKAMARVCKSYRMMLDFYGLQLNSETGDVDRADHWKLRFQHLNRSFHNYLRITRILKSLGELGCEKYKMPLLDRIIQEAFKENELINCRESCELYWIETVRDDGERELLHQLIEFSKQNKYSSKQIPDPRLEYMDSKKRLSGQRVENRDSEEKISDQKGEYKDSEKKTSNHMEDKNNEEKKSENITDEKPQSKSTDHAPCRKEEKKTPENKSSDLNKDVDTAVGDQSVSESVPSGASDGAQAATSSGVNDVAETSTPSDARASQAGRDDKAKSIADNVTSDTENKATAENVNVKESSQVTEISTESDREKDMTATNSDASERSDKSTEQVNKEGTTTDGSPSSNSSNKKENGVKSRC